MTNSINKTPDENKEKVLFELIEFVSHTKRTNIYLK